MENLYCKRKECFICTIVPRLRTWSLYVSGNKKQWRTCHLTILSPFTFLGCSPSVAAPKISHLTLDRFVESWLTVLYSNRGVITKKRFAARAGREELGLTGATFLVQLSDCVHCQVTNSVSSVPSDSWGFSPGLSKSGLQAVFEAPLGSAYRAAGRPSPHTRPLPPSLSKYHPWMSFISFPHSLLIFESLQLSPSPQI